MTHQLIIGNRLYFSWSLAAWLMVDRFGLSDYVKTTVLYPATEDGVGALMTDYAPARTLPTMITSDGAILSDSMAIGEELASLYPNAGLWPAAPLARGTARALANEMHSSFRGLRAEWPVNLHRSYAPVQPSESIAAELDRLEAIWAHARAVTGQDTPWLCGDYSIADAIFAPMAIRLANYGFDTRPATKAYVAAHLADPALRRWRAMGLAANQTSKVFEYQGPTRPWPGPTPLAAEPVDTGTAENAACPYSGDPVTHLAEIGQRIFGFCNAFCRDKTVADPAAWPAFMTLYRR
ncbi:glutathione S-transferase [Loktanella salsilacus]|uniref:glutathione S-transferase n=1 Tax=Loktanella salsilacus TaxID=195913 RepID=UPI0037358814